MKLMERMKQKRLGNKGFSLVELIIVIAIMAILIGIVGTQVVPYLNRAREEKDMQIIDAFSTAAVTFYSLHTDLFADAEKGSGSVMTYIVFTSAIGGYPNADTDTWKKDFAELVGYSNDSNGLEALQGEMSSTKGKTIIGINIMYNFTQSSISIPGSSYSAPAGAVTAYAYTTGGSVVLEPATSYIGSAQ